MRHEVTATNNQDAAQASSWWGSLMGWWSPQPSGIHATEDHPPLSANAESPFEGAFAAQQESEMKRYIRQIHDLRRYITNLLGLKQATLTQVKQSFEQNVHPNLETPELNDLDYFWDELNDSELDFITRLKDKAALQSPEFYHDKTRDIKDLAYKLQCKALCKIIFDDLTQALNQVILYPQTHGLSPTKPVVTDFIEFIQALNNSPHYLLRSDPDTEKLMPILNLYIQQNTEQVYAILRRVQLLYLNVKENRQALKRLTDHLHIWIGYFIDPTKQSIVRLLRDEDCAQVLPFQYKVQQIITPLHSDLKQFTQTQQKIKWPTSTDSEPANLELVILKAKLERVLNQYNDYSKNHCHYSIRHRHGAQGRQRAENIVNELCRHKSVTDIHQKIINYLVNPTNGNAHPHSFRTLLLESFIGPISIKSQASCFASNIRFFFGASNEPAFKAAVEQLITQWNTSSRQQSFSL